MALDPVVALGVGRRALRAPRAVVLVDGRSGSGKTTFAAALAAEAGVRLLRLDDVYPGWDGMAAASRILVDAVLVPRRSGAPGRWRQWDWPADRPDGAGVVPANGPLVVEGCGALTRASARFATLSVWLELRPEERRRRALDRDGEAFRPHWDRWAAQEARAIAHEDPRRLADVTVDGRRFPHALFSARTENGQYPRRP